MADRYKDFDAFFAEHERQPVRFKILGEEIILPPDLPAALIVKIVKMNRDRDTTETIMHEEMLDMLTMLIGEENFNKLMAKGLDIGQVEQIVPWIMNTYMGNAEGNEGNDLETPQGGRQRTKKRRKTS